mgnify:CR=1 FL=1
MEPKSCNPHFYLRCSDRFLELLRIIFMSHRIPLELYAALRWPPDGPDKRFLVGMKHVIITQPSCLDGMTCCRRTKTAQASLDHTGGILHTLRKLQLDQRSIIQSNHDRALQNTIRFHLSSPLCSIHYHTSNCSKFTSPKHNSIPPPRHNPPSLLLIPPLPCRHSPHRYLIILFRFNSVLLPLAPPLPIHRHMSDDMKQNERLMLSF